MNIIYRIYSYKCPGGDAFFKKRGWGGGGRLLPIKNQLSSPVAMGDNGHLQP